MLHCNGKCQMMKKIRAEEKKEQESQERKMGSKVEVLSSKSFFTSTSELFSTLIYSHYFTGTECNEMHMPRSIFHPPGA